MLLSLDLVTEGPAVYHRIDIPVFTGRDGSVSTIVSHTKAISQDRRLPIPIKTMSDIALRVSMTPLYKIE
ncbi:hypothetical protein W02_02280 [Nitrospira sp. KM1]|nr:hypothetical protein W02_02280 [Nitrospira sp. KM1]